MAVMLDSRIYWCKSECPGQLSPAVLRGWEGHVACSDGTGSCLLVPWSTSCTYFSNLRSIPWISQNPPINSLPIYINRSWFLLFATNDPGRTTNIRISKQEIYVLYFYGIGGIPHELLKVICVIKMYTWKKNQYEILSLTLPKPLKASHEATIKKQIYFIFLELG